MLGLSFLICPLLMKAILVYIVYTAKTKQRKKIRWYSSMLLAGTGFLIAVNASILGWWQSTQSYEPIHYVVKGYEYIECNSFITVSAKTAGAVVSFVLAFTLFALLVIVLLVSHVHPVHNETNVVVIFCSLIVILAVPIKFLPFDENYAIREAIVIWMIGIYVPVTRITPKLYEIFARINHKTLQPQFTSNASQNSQLFTSIRDRRLISDTTQTSIRENHSPKAKIKSLIGLTSFRVRSRWRLHSSWIAVSQSTMCFVNTKLWIELVSNDGIYTFPILQDTHLEEKQSKVQVITKAGARKSPTGNDTFFSGYDLEVGFENCNEKKSLISDIHKAQLCVHNELKT
ncbi:hypothetical protein BCR33DRAFT_222123 [Rhizoclosmatium globosum]|uniref:G-protein coupled receptors family 3 profile domain-containing protein n=1 Tax=Rhizoclosmatium globosum TaxID=329046 RepID=A0A1Y2CBP1_9FUNG|nr:hypothetical protein BCR33DRAFT_222123 [Rhizoclosmatium globosum]|eukprot:ORY44442.1 hypothetical protein BCR33DRAFT_222123 [Rhizoclosmatium globosum]